MRTGLTGLQGTSATKRRLEKVAEFDQKFSCRYDGLQELCATRLLGNGGGMTV
jgi:hypothetical protein